MVDKRQADENPIPVLHHHYAHTAVIPQIEMPTHHPFPKRDWAQTSHDLQNMPRPESYDAMTNHESEMYQETMDFLRALSDSMNAEGQFFWLERTKY